MPRHSILVLSSLALLASSTVLVPARATPAAQPTKTPASERTTPFAAPTRPDQGRLNAADRSAATKHDVSSRVAAATHPLAVGEGATALGVEWSGRAGKILVQWRFTPTGGSAGAWSELPVGEHGPDAVSKEAAQSRSVSDPVLTSEPGAVEFRALGAALPRGLQAFRHVAGSAPKVSSSDTTPEKSDSQGALAGPTILSRASWGADESIRKGEPSYGAVKGEVVHHTVNANTYTAAQVPALIRAIYEYHVLRNGWNDIGYNFLIDRFGRVWEGRYGGSTKAVVGAHSPGVNSWTTSAAAIGDFSSSGATVPAAVTTAYRDLFAWKAKLHQVDPDWTVNLGGKTQRAISGHRDNISTECPGAALYARIPSIKSAASAATANIPAFTVRRDADNDGGNDVLLRDSQGVFQRVRSGDGGQLERPATMTGLPSTGIDLTRVAGDWDGDGAVDVLARSTSTGALLMYAGDGAGAVQSPVQVGNGWSIMRLLTTVGDLTGDGHPDVVGATTATSELRVYPGNGRGGFLAPKVIGTNWTGIASIVGVGDWDRDGRPDLLGVTKSGAAIVYANAGGGMLRNGPTLGISVPAPAVVTAIGDATGDGLVDLAVKDASGQVRVAASSGSGAGVAWIAQSAATVEAWRALTPQEG